MKCPDLKKWKYDVKLEGLLFFAQAVEELLFTYSLDSYKVPAMNSATLCNELSQTIDEIEDRVMREGAIRPIVEELSESLRGDAVSTKLLGEIKDEFIECINKHDSIGEIKVRTELLKSRLSGDYLVENTRLLKEAVVDGNQKENIMSLTRTFVSQLISLGYSPEFIYFETENFFFTGKFPFVINDVAQIETYFKRFNLQETDFVVIFRVSRNFEQLKDYVTESKIKIQSETPQTKFAKQSVRVNEFLSPNETFPLFLIVEEVKAYDTFIAKRKSDARIQLLESLAKYHVHRENFQWSEEAVVGSSDGKLFGVYKSPVPATYKRPEKESNLLSNFVTKTTATIASNKIGVDSLSRFVRAFIRHDMALKSEEPESQLLELWAAIEVLFSTYEKGEDKILQIARGVVPFETDGYAAKLCSDLYSSLTYLNSDKVTEIIDGIGVGANAIDRCLALVAIQDNEDKRIKLYQELVAHPLLKNRIFILKNKLFSARVIRNSLIAHDRRVTWQLQRVYRARNLIIHSGRSLPYIAILVENLHTYLDRVLDILIEEVSVSKFPTGIDEICVAKRLEYDSHLRLLDKAKDEHCTGDNYKTLLFGH